MFSKSFIILALLTCQRTTATQLAEIESRSLTDLIPQVTEIIKGLNGLVSGPIGDALSVLTNQVSNIASVQQNFLNDGLKIISQGINNVLEFVANRTVQAAELGVDITKCIVGTNKILMDLNVGFTKNVTDCVTNTANSVSETVNSEINNIKAIIKTIIAAPTKLSKCIISLRPITCVTNLLADLTKMITTIPGQIANVVENTTELVQKLPANLATCLSNIANSVKIDTTAIIKEIDDCVNDVISQTTTVAPS